MPGPGGGFGGFGSLQSSSDDSTAGGNLVWVQAYGIATLYEKFEKAPAKKDDATATPGPGTTPPKGGPAPMTPMGAPAPMTPMGAPAPMTPPMGTPAPMGVPMPTVPMTPATPPKM
jgi:hypothetical protein